MTKISDSDKNRNDAKKELNELLENLMKKYSLDQLDMWNIMRYIGHEWTPYLVKNSNRFEA